MLLFRDLFVEPGVMLDWLLRDVFRIDRGFMMGVTVIPKHIINSDFSRDFTFNLSLSLTSLKQVKSH
jgi:hypothetical protein